MYPERREWEEILDKIVLENKIYSYYSMYISYITKYKEEYDHLLAKGHEQIMFTNPKIVEKDI